MKKVSWRVVCVLNVCCLNLLGQRDKRMSWLFKHVCTWQCSAFWFSLCCRQRIRWQAFLPKRSSKYCQGAPRCHRVSELTHWVLVWDDRQREYCEILLADYRHCSLIVEVDAYCRGLPRTKRKFPHHHWSRVSSTGMTCRWGQQSRLPFRKESLIGELQEARSSFPGRVYQRSWRSDCRAREASCFAGSVGWTCQPRRGDWSRSSPRFSRANRLRCAWRKGLSSWRLGLMRAKLGSHSWAKQNECQ